MRGASLRRHARAPALAKAHALTALARTCLLRQVCDKRLTVSDMKAGMVRARARERESAWARTYARRACERVGWTCCRTKRRRPCEVCVISG